MTPDLVNMLPESEQIKLTYKDDKTSEEESNPDTGYDRHILGERKYGHDPSDDVLSQTKTKWSTSNSDRTRARKNQ